MISTNHPILICNFTTMYSNDHEIILLHNDIYKSSHLCISMYHNDHEIVLLYDNDMCKSSRLSHPNLDHAIMSDLPISVCEISQSVICVPRPANPV